MTLSAKAIYVYYLIVFTGWESEPGSPKVAIRFGLVLGANRRPGVSPKLAWLLVEFISWSCSTPGGFFTFSWNFLILASLALCGEAENFQNHQVLVPFVYHFFPLFLSLLTPFPTGNKKKPVHPSNTWRETVLSYVTNFLTYRFCSPPTISTFSCCIIRTSFLQFPLTCLTPWVLTSDTFIIQISINGPLRSFRRHYASQYSASLPPPLCLKAALKFQVLVTAAPHSRYHI